MGPNGSGKSTLAYALMGHPAYQITEGRLLFDGEDVTELAADERAQRGLFLAFQYPHAIPGVTVTSFLRSAINAVRKARNGGVDDPIAIPEFRKELLAQMDRLKVSRELASRYLNDGFSGGEKKRVEILQMAMLKPRIAVLDETDSGLDIDALRVVAGGVKRARRPGDGRARDHALPADPRLHHARPRPRLRRRPDRRGRRPGAREEAREGGLRALRARGGAGVMAQTETESRPGDRLRLRDQVRVLRHRRTTSSSPAAGSTHELVDAISSHKDEPDWMRKFRHQSLDYFLARPLPKWGGDLTGIDFDNIFYYIKPTEKQANSWEDLPADIKDTWDKLGIPEAEKKYLAGVGAQYESEVVYHKLQEDLTDEGRALPRHGLGAARARGARQAVLRDDHPAERQQVRGAQLGGLVGRLVHLRAAGRAHRDAAAGLLPDQRREHGPVRADADPRRRGRVRPLRRGLHGADLLDRLAALSGRRDRRQEGRPLPLHDDPELVEQRLQPRHEARRRLRGRDDGVGRREPRLEADDEVPGDLADGRARARRGALDRVRRQGPASGRGRQGRPRRAEHDLGDHVQVDLEERRPRRLPRPAPGGPAARSARSRRSSATRSSSTRTRAPTRTRTSRSTRTRSTSATRRPSRRSARSSSSTSCRAGSPRRRRAR